MKKEEALQHFIEQEVKPRSVRMLLALEQYFQLHMDELARDFITSFHQVCETIQDKQTTGEKGRISSITYSMLRTEIWEGRHTYLIEAFDATWFFDRVECQADYDASWAFCFLAEWEHELKQAAKAYMGIILPTDIERLVCKEAEKYNEYIVCLARYALPQAVILPEHIEIKVEEEWEVRVGEYLDRSEIVYKEDTRVKDAIIVKEWLEEKKEHDYAYEVFSHMNISYGNYEGSDWRYADVRKSDLSYSNLRGCVLVGTMFVGAHLQGIDCSGSVIHEADFSHSDLRGAMFHHVQGVRGQLTDTAWEMPGYRAVSFAGADLTEASFAGANLTGAIFVGANVTATDFTGAIVENAQFSQEDREKVMLDDTQRAGVIWKP